MRKHKVCDCRYFSISSVYTGAGAGALSHGSMSLDSPNTCPSRIAKAAGNCAMSITRGMWLPTDLAQSCDIDRALLEGEPLSPPTATRAFRACVPIPSALSACSRRLGQPAERSDRPPTPAPLSIWSDSTWKQPVDLWEPQVHTTKACDFKSTAPSAGPPFSFTCMQSETSTKSISSIPSSCASSTNTSPSTSSTHSLATGISRINVNKPHTPSASTETNPIAPHHHDTELYTIKVSSINEHVHETDLVRLFASPPKWPASHPMVQLYTHMRQRTGGTWPIPDAPAPYSVHSAMVREILTG